MSLPTMDDSVGTSYLKSPIATVKNVPLGSSATDPALDIYVYQTPSLKNTINGYTLSVVMNTRSDALRSGPRLATPEGSGEPTGKDILTPSVKNWILIPIFAFHIIGFVVLVALMLFFMSNEERTPQYFWPALVVGITGLPFAFASNVKKLVDAVSVG